MWKLTRVIGWSVATRPYPESIEFLSGALYKEATTAWTSHHQCQRRRRPALTMHHHPDVDDDDAHLQPTETRQWRCLPTATPTPLSMTMTTSTYSPQRYANDDDDPHLCKQWRTGHNCRHHYCKPWQTCHEQFTAINLTKILLVCILVKLDCRCTTNWKDFMSMSHLSNQRASPTNNLINWIRSHCRNGLTRTVNNDYR